MTKVAGRTQVVVLEGIECSDCGLVYGMPEEYVRRRRDDHRRFYCPSGHEQWFPYKSELERAREELDAARTIAANERARRQTAERRAAAARGQVTKIKRRVGRGVCPCCKRTFEDLARHMEGQHPDYAESP